MSDSDLFKRIGFDDKKAAETAKNKDLSATLRAIVEEVCCSTYFGWSLIM